MKSRIVALALAAVMTLGSCMSASAKEVFTKGLIGATVVKNSAYVESVDVIDIDIWNKANANSFWTYGNFGVTQNSVTGNAQASINVNGTTVDLANFIRRSPVQFTTEQQLLLETIMQQYGQTVVRTTDTDTALSAPYASAWSYAQWVATMQIAPYAERYIVAMNYKQLYKNLNEALQKAVAQGQIMVSDAYANSSELTTAKKAFRVLDARITTVAANNKLSGATIKVDGFNEFALVNGTNLTTTANGDYQITLNNGAINNYVLYPAFNGVPMTSAAVKPEVGTTAEVYVGQYIAVPVAGTVLGNLNIRYYNAGTLVNKTIKDGQAFGYRTPVVAADGANTLLTPIEIMRNFVTYATDDYKKMSDNALAIAKEMQTNFADAQKYYEGEEKAGLAYLIGKVRPDLEKVTADNIKASYGFDVDPYDKLKWDLNETKTIALTSPSINDNMKDTDSCVVLHFNTTACKWESIPAKFVHYNNVLGIEGDFKSCSPVIVVTLKDWVDNGGAAAKATDAKKSPATGENF